MARLTSFAWWTRRRTKRSEEHTSELQSRLHLVCRLLLEKKKKKRTQLHPSRQKRPHTTDHVRSRQLHRAEPCIQPPVTQAPLGGQLVGGQQAQPADQQLA